MDHPKDHSLFGLGLPGFRFQISRHLPTLMVATLNPCPKDARSFFWNDSALLLFVFFWSRNFLSSHRMSVSLNSGFLFVIDPRLPNTFGFGGFWDPKKPKPQQVFGRLGRFDVPEHGWWIHHTCSYPSQFAQNLPKNDSANLKVALVAWFPHGVKLALCRFFIKVVVPCLLKRDPIRILVMPDVPGQVSYDL